MVVQTDGSSRRQGSGSTPAPGPLGIPPFLLKSLITAFIGGTAYLLTNITDQPEVWKLTASIFLGARR